LPIGSYSITAVVANRRDGYANGVNTSRPPTGEAAARVNPRAVASFVLGCFWFVGLTSPVAFLLGRDALAEIRETGQRGRRLARAGMALGLFGTAVILLSVVGMFWVYGAI